MAPSRRKCSSPIDGEAVGLEQRYRFSVYPEYIAELAGMLDVEHDALSIDYLVGPTHALGRGVGMAMIGEFVHDTWQAHPLMNSIVIPVHADNRSS
jgi:aminoglycoside 6'-N-acetyltransferase